MKVSESWQEPILPIVLLGSERPGEETSAAMLSFFISSDTRSTKGSRRPQRRSSSPSPEKTSSPREARSPEEPPRAAPQTRPSSARLLSRLILWRTADTDPRLPCATRPSHSLLSLPTRARCTKGRPVDGREPASSSSPGPHYPYIHHLFRPVASRVCPRWSFRSRFPLLCTVYTRRGHDKYALF